MTTQLRQLHSVLRRSSTQEQQSLCDEYVRTIDSPAPTLVGWFVQDLAANATFDNVNQPFINPRTAQGRLPTHEGSSRTRIVHLISAREGFDVVGASAEYRFNYRGRELGPRRIEGADLPTSGAGGVDYFGNALNRPVIGETKVGGDQNSFYAFVQLLAYLSELATPNQVRRANRHMEFGVQLSDAQPFDLHILLADFNGRGTKVPLIESTKQLASKFKKRLAALYPNVAGYVGNILCLRLDSKSFAGSPKSSLQCIWCV